MVSSLGTGIVTTPTLFGLDPSELVKEATVGDLQTLKERKEAEEERTKLAQTRSGPSDVHLSGSITFTEYDSVFDLISDTSGEKHIHAISKNAWVQVAPNKYVLSGPGKTYIRLEKVEDATEHQPKFEAFELRPLPQAVASKAPYASPRKLFKASTFTDAVHAADSYASETYPYALITRNQAWRKGTPTEGQLKFLNQFRDADRQLQDTDITKGKATDMITKLRHGARGRFATIDASRRRREKQVLADEQRSARERVSVGPLAA